LPGSSSATPAGVIAGAIANRELSVQMFEGYASTG
jgi:hypothetical protein